MDKEKREMEEAIANSLIDQKRLESERDKQRLELVAHFKSKVTTSTIDNDPEKNTGIVKHNKFCIRMFYIQILLDFTTNNSV